MVNVPTGVWIDEEGRIVRPNEVAYSRDISFGDLIAVNGGDYVAALRDWVEKGAASPYAMSVEEVTQKLGPRSTDQGGAEAHFKLGVYFHEQGEEALADRHWELAQKLRPDSWNYHRQDWSFTPEEAGPKWMSKFRSLKGEPYYEPLELKTPTGEER